MKYILLFTIFTFFFNTLQSQDMNDFDLRVEYSGSKANGTVDVISYGFGKKVKPSVENASKNCIYAILFRGIPGSQYNLPMINNESEMIDNKVIKDLLNNGFGSFITYIETLSDQKKTRKKDGAKGIETMNKITINCEALRRYLEEKKIIRKFGL